MRRIKHIPDWAPKDPARWPLRCTPTKDGWVMWYKGRTRFVCGKGVPLADVPEQWYAKKRTIDAAEAAPVVAAAEEAEPVRFYRDVLSEFLGVQQAKVGAKNRPRSERTYHNYVVELNKFGAFTYQGVKVADMDICDIGPAVFTAYAGKYRGWAASGFDSVVSRVSALFRWAVEMEYIDRFRPGPEFVRPEKQEIRDQRIDLVKSYPMEALAKMWLAGNPTYRCWIALGLCGGMNNGDVANLPKGKPVVDLEAGIIDYRRRKTGKKRRVIPLPPDVCELLKTYQRPAAAVPMWNGLFFLTQEGNTYTRTRSRSGNYMPNNAVTTCFLDLEERAGVAHVDKRNFSGVRTTAWNAWPRGEWELERKIVFGRNLGGVDLDNYLEDVGLDRLRHCINHNWGLFKAALAKVTEESKVNSERPGAADAPMTPSEPATGAAA